MNAKNIIPYFFSLVVLIFEFYFGILAGVGFVIQVILLALLFASILNFFSKDKTVSFLGRVKIYSSRILAILGFFTSIFLIFTGYYTFFPGNISDIVISNGTQKVVFVSMSHIAVPAFYDKKRLTLEDLAKKSYTFLVEGVGAGSDASQKAFNNALGIQFDKDLYPTLASVAGLEVQSGGFLFSNIPPNLLHNVDMSLDEIVGLMGTGYNISPSLSGGVDMGAELDLVGELPPQEQAFIQYVFRSILNWSIINMTDIETITNTENKILFDIILHKRNERIVDYIIHHPDQHIAVVYGALHFSGILESLAKTNPDWQIVSYTSDTPYSE